MKLTIEEKRIKLAEACGWTVYKGKRELVGVKHAGGDVWPTSIPDYANDLNAMHEAEKVLAQDGAFNTPGSWQKYAHLLYFYRDRVEPNFIIHAPAHQRFEALGQTLNLWEAGQ